MFPPVEVTLKCPDCGEPLRWEAYYEIPSKPVRTEDGCLTVEPIFIGNKQLKPSMVKVICDNCQHSVLYQGNGLQTFQEEEPDCIRITKPAKEGLVTNTCSSLEVDHLELVVKPLKDQNSLPGKLLVCLLSKNKGNDPLKVIEDVERNKLKNRIEQAEKDNYYHRLYALYKEYPEILSDSTLQEVRKLLKHYADMNVLLRAPSDSKMCLDWTTDDYKAVLQEKGFLPSDENALLVHSAIFWSDWLGVAIEEGLYHINGAIRKVRAKLQRNPTVCPRAPEDQNLGK